MLVYIFILKFGVNNGLAVIQAVVTGEHIAGSCGDEKIIGIVKAEQFEGNEHGGNGTVGNAAEHGDHAYRRAQGCREAPEGVPTVQPKVAPMNRGVRFHRPYSRRKS